MNAPGRPIGPRSAFIQESYDDKATRDRLYAHIYLNTRHDDSDCYWIGSHNGVEGLLAETQRTRDRNGKREKHGFDRDASFAFEDAPEGIAVYLAAPPEFHTRKAEAFLLRYAIDAAARRIEHEIAEARLMIAIQIGFFVVAAIVVAAVSSGLTAAGVAWKAPWWQAPWQLEWIAGAVTVAVVAGFLFREFYCFVAATRFGGVKAELCALSFDPETIAARLKAIEASTGSQLPTYVYTLLKRLDGAFQYAEG